MTRFIVQLMNTLDVVFAAALFIFSVVVMSEVDVSIVGGSFIPWTDAVLTGGCAAWFITRGVYRWLRM